MTRINREMVQIFFTTQNFPNPFVNSSLASFFYTFSIFTYVLESFSTVQCLHVVKTVTTLQAYSIHQALTMWSEKKRHLCRQLVAHFV